MAATRVVGPRSDTWQETVFPDAGSPCRARGRPHGGEKGARVGVIVDMVGD